MAHRKTFDMKAECSPEGVLIRDPNGESLTREFRVKYPEQAKEDDDARRKTMKKDETPNVEEEK